MEVGRAVAVDAKCWKVFLGFAWNQLFRWLVTLTVFKTQLTKASFDTKYIIAGWSLCANISFEKLQLFFCHGFEFLLKFLSQAAIHIDKIMHGSSEAHVTFFVPGA